MRRGGGGDKRTQFWSSIDKEKLDTLKWVLLHSGISVPTLQNDDGYTGLQIASMRGKDKAVLLMCDIMRQKREIGEAIDVADDRGRTPLMLASMYGHGRCVDHLLYYGASKTRKSAEGMTARDYAVKANHKDVVELFDEDVAAADTGAEAAEAVDADGLTSTQRNKLKKKQLKEAERRGMVAAVTAAAAAGGDEGDDEAGAAGAEAAAGAVGGAAGATAVRGAATGAAGGLPALGPTPTPRWAEVKAVLDEKRRELNIHRAAPTGDDAAAAGAAPAGGAPEEAIDPAVWHCVLLNRLELHVPSFTVLPPQIGHLAALQTLILSGNGLTALAEEIGLLTELKFLDISNNALVELPAALAKLKKIEVLNAASNRLASLAPIAECTSFTSLSLDHNELTELTLNFEGLARLATLTVSHNKLTALPEEWSGLASLAVLNIADNAVEELPAGLAELPEKKLRDLRLLPNPIADKKVLKILNSDRPEKVVKELFKYLAASGGGGKGKKGKGKH